MSSSAAAARRGRLFVLSAPSGAGKTTVCRGVVERDPGVAVSVSHTTRAPRDGEVGGRDYHFVSADEFRRLVAKGAFLEHAEYSGNLYGTSWAAIEATLARGDDALLEIETEGARQVKQRRSDAHLIFLLPPSLAVLEARLRGRGTEGDEEVDRRLAIARREFAAAAIFDHFVVNDAAARAVADVLAIVAAVRAGDPAALGDRFSLPRVRAVLDPALAAWLP
jgi:guanylate kinase